MFTGNPFADLSAFISPAVMQPYIVVMGILVAAGTIYDVLHKKSAQYFRQKSPPTHREPPHDVWFHRVCPGDGCHGVSL